MCIKNSNSKALALFLLCSLLFASCGKFNLRKQQIPELEEFDASLAFTISSGDMDPSASEKTYATLQVEANSMQYGDYVAIHGLGEYNQLIPKYDIHLFSLCQFIYFGELQQEATMTIYQVDFGDSNFVFDENFEYYQPYMIELIDSDPINSILDTNNWTPITTYYYDSTSTLPYSSSDYLRHELGTSFKINDLDAIYCLAREF